MWSRQQLVQQNLKVMCSRQLCNVYWLRRREGGGTDWCGVLEDQLVGGITWAHAETHRPSPFSTFGHSSADCWPRCCCPRGRRDLLSRLGRDPSAAKSCIDVLLEEPVFGIKPVTFFSRDLICQVQITACEILSFVFGHRAHSEHLENVCSS